MEVENYPKWKECSYGHVMLTENFIHEFLQLRRISLAKPIYLDELQRPDTFRYPNQKVVKEC